MYFGGNSELRGYEYLEFLGNKAFFAQRRTALPADRGGAHADRRDRRAARRHVLANFGGAGYEGLPMTVWTSNAETLHAAARLRGGSVLAHRPDSRSSVRPITLDGFRLIDSRASYGVGLETFALGFPIHFDWSWRTLFNQRLGRPGLRVSGRERRLDRPSAATGSARSSSRCGSATTSRADDAKAEGRSDKSARTETASGASDICLLPSAFCLDGVSYRCARVVVRTRCGCWWSSWNTSCRPTSMPSSSGIWRDVRAA